MSDSPRAGARGGPGAPVRRSRAALRRVLARGVPLMAVVLAWASMGARGGPPQHRVGQMSSSDYGFLRDALLPAAGDSTDRDAVDARLREFESRYPGEPRVAHARLLWLLHEPRPFRAVAPSVDSLLALVMPRMGGRWVALRCLEVVDALKRRGESPASVERYAERAVAWAETHSDQLYGSSYLPDAEARAYRALGEARWAVGKREQALAALREATLRVEDEAASIRPAMWAAYARRLHESGRTDEALGAWFEAACMPSAGANVDAETAALRAAWIERFGSAEGLGARIETARRTWRAWPLGMGSFPVRDRRAPDAELERLGGGRMRLGEMRGRPLVLVFWGSWSAPNRAAVRLAEAWHRMPNARARVVTIDWELPGPGDLGRTLARACAARESLTVPVLLDPDGAVFRSFALQGYPAFVLVDAAGNVGSKTIGLVENFNGSHRLVDSLDVKVRAFMTAP